MTGSTATLLPGLDEEPTSAPMSNARLRAWVAEIAELTSPDRVVCCDGSDAEWDRMTAKLVEAGTFVQLDEARKPNSFYAAETAIGYVPTAEQIDLDGLDAPAADVNAALAFDAEEWKAELPLIEEWFAKVGDRLPSSMRDELAALRQRLDDKIAPYAGKVKQGERGGQAAPGER